MPKIPSIYMSRGAYKDGTVFSVLPTDGSGDLDFVRGSDATRINENNSPEVMTGNTPRFDYTGGGCPNLLIEGADGSRNREEFSKGGLSDEIDNDEGVLYLETKAISNTGSKRYISLCDSQNLTRIAFYFDEDDNKVEISNGIVDSSFSLEVLNFNKYALRYNSNSMDLFVNGEKTQTTVPARTYIDLDCIVSNDGEGVGYFEGRIRDLRIYKGSMTDNELEDLTKNDIIIVDIDYPIFYGSVVSKPTNSAEVVVLNSRMASDGDLFTLDTNTGNFIFCFWLPDTVELESVTDLDALSAVITNSYESELLSLNVVGYSEPISGKLYTMTQGVPYDNNHRHQIAIK